MKYREIAKKLRKLGCLETGTSRKSGGSHRKWYNPERSPIIVVSIPDWQAKDLKVGTLRAIVKDLKLDWDEFIKA